MYDLTFVLDDSTIQVDFSNVFNSIDCGALFKEIRAHIPSMVAWMEPCYWTQTLLYLGGHSIRVAVGYNRGRILWVLLILLGNFILMLSGYLRKFLIYS